MSSRGLVMLALASRCGARACGDNETGDERQGGDTTVDDRDARRSAAPAANLSVDEGIRFQAGRSPFDFQWEPPQARPAVQQQRVRRLSRRATAAGCR